MCVWYWLPASGYYGCSSPETASPVTQILASSQSPSLFTVSVNEFAHCLFTIGAHQLRRHDNSVSIRQTPSCKCHEVFSENFGDSQRYL